MATLRSALPKSEKFRLKQYFPFFGWLFHYHREDLIGDLMAAFVVTVMLVPQSMAYALLAGLPPKIGLYASIVPLLIYGLLGTSRVLSVGPVAMVSLLVATWVRPLVESLGYQIGTPGYINTYVQFALILGLLVSIIQTGTGLLRLGLLVNFLSRPVLSGFISAGAFIIGFSQLKHFLGISIPHTTYLHEQLFYAAQHITESNPVTIGIGLGSITILLYFKIKLETQLKRWGLSELLIIPITRSAPLVIVVLGTLLVWIFNFHELANVEIVGQVPAGLPPLTYPWLVDDRPLWYLLIPAALAISFVGFMESISMAKSLASKRREKIDANQELVALGLANLGAAFSSGYPVTGSFSRSVVSFAAGANTGLASIITAGLMTLTVIFLTPLFFFLPKVVLAAIIIVAAVGLVDIRTLKHTWQYNKADAAELVVTFLAVLLVGIEIGLPVGLVTPILLFLWRTNRPHTAIVGHLGDSGMYRNVLYHNVKICPHVVAIRIDESLYFANTKFLEDTILGLVADRPEIKHLVLICSAINFIDSSALETLEALIEELHDAGVEFYLTEVKDYVFDRLTKIGFVDKLGPDYMYMKTHDLMVKLDCV